MTGTLRRETPTSVTGKGDDAAPTIELFSFEGIRDNFNAFYMATYGIPASDVRILIIMNLINPRTIPKQDDKILIRGEWHKVRRVLEIDPASASIVLQCFTISTPT